MKTLLITCLFGLSLGLASARADEPKKDDSKKEETKAAATDAKEVAVIKTTAGDMVIEFWPDVAPKTVENFKKLAKEGYYDGTCFHRVIKGFMIQGGDPNTKDPAKEGMWGRGGPGYTIQDEFSKRPHERGVISMASTGAPNSGGSQFFICLPSADDPHMQYLNGRYAVFGKLIKGDDVLGKIGSTPTHPPDRPDEKQEVISIKIVPAASIKS